MEIATFGGGCFWCLEAIFQRVQGVKRVTSGYAGGKDIIKNPTYKEVCSGLTNYAEVIQIEFDENLISYSELLQIFWYIHNPTTLNRQGNDIGTQYRSVVFYHSDKQRELAIKSKERLEKTNLYLDPVVTEITKIKNFYPAESYHQNYFNLNQNDGYCEIVIKPKIRKLEGIFKEILKRD